MNTPAELLSAVRQFRHNNQDDFVFGYDAKETERQFAVVKTKMDVKLEALNEINAKLAKLSGNGKIDTVLKLIQSDPHQWSSRGCQTCRTITELTNQDFGCNLYRKQNK